MPIAAAALFATLTWWMATGIILYLDGLPARTYGRSLGLATVLMAAAFAGVMSSAMMPTVAGAFCAFSCAIVVWGWVELSFLTGFLTGPRRHACATGCKGLAHMRHATEAILYHELVILVLVGLLTLATWNKPNQVALGTFVILWLMRISAKLNLFLGVRNLGEALLPDHLAYLGSFLRRRSMNALFPWSMLVGSAVAIVLARRALVAGASPFDITASSLLAALVALAVVEHGFMMLPLPLDALWAWGMRSRDTSASRPRI